MELFNKILQIILETALPILVSAAAVWMIAKIKEVLERIKEHKPDAYYTLIEICQVGVRAAEQIYKGKARGPEKKQYVINLTEKWLASKGINLDLDMIEAAIESEVRTLNLDNPNKLMADSEAKNK